MIDLRFRPCFDWPNNKIRIGASFRSTYAKTLDLLERELGYLRAKDIVIQAAYELADIRNDGWPRSGTRPKFPGAILSFHGKVGELCFPCDRYNRFEDNLRAIALSLEALRAVDRYGVTQRAEQYKGWGQLEAPGQESAKDRNWALRFIATNADCEPEVLTNDEAIQEAYRLAARKLHPDAQTTGSDEAFLLLQEAKKLAQ